MHGQMTCSQAASPRGYKKELGEILANFTVTCNTTFKPALLVSSLLVNLLLFLKQDQ